MHFVAPFGVHFTGQFLLRWALMVQVYSNIASAFAGRPWFGSVTVWGWNGSSGSGFRFRRFLCKEGFPVFQYSLTGKDCSGSGFGSWKPAVPVPLSVSGKTVPTVPVPGSGPEPPCICVNMCFGNY